MIHLLPPLFLGIMDVNSARVWAKGELDSQISVITEKPCYRESYWGLLFVDQTTGESLYSQNQDKVFAPASVAKMFSVAAALEGLGADYRFATTVVRRGDVDSTGTLAGDLVLIASGDLTLGGRTTETGEMAFSRSDHTYAGYMDDVTLTAPDPLAGLNTLARDVAAAGIRRVTGNIVIDDRFFDRAEGSGSGPSILTPIIVNDNVLDFLIEPSTPGQAAKVTCRPQTAQWTVVSKIETSVRASRTAFRLQEEGHTLILSGQIAEGREPFVQVFELPDPAQFARGLFAEALHRAGVTTSAGSPSTSAPGPLPPRDVILGLPRVALLRSLPFSENVRLILKVSHNLHANVLPLLLAAKNGQRTLAEGLLQEKSFLIRAGVNVDSISLGGGSGGTRADFVTPTATVKLLRYMSTQPDFLIFKRGLPIMGVDGTLATAVPIDSVLWNRVHAKTGTLTWSNGLRDQPFILSKALAGYLTTRAGRQVVFVEFVNNVHSRPDVGAKDVGADLIKICELVYEMK